MTHMKRLTLLILLALAATTAAAQDKYPAKPIKVVLPFGPGSATDIVMRIVGEQMRPILGQPVVIENKPGAFGILAIEEMARSKPDGYTLQIGNPGTNVLTPIIYKKKFKIDYEKEVILVTRLSEIPIVLGATTKDFPPKTFAEFIAYAKANPGKVRYASVGVGSNNHYDTEAFAQWAGIVLTHLPNKGGGAAITNDLVTGDAHIALLNAASSLGVVKGGQVRALAVMSDQRLPEYPDVPTLKELGYSNSKGLWSALYAPAATPRDVLEVVRQAAVQALGSEQVTTAFKQQMIRAVPNASFEDAQTWNKAELAYWKKVTDEVKVELPD
ncbi:MAG: tripartite tricarboxylate transporter substrate binding protein [Alphaproteobacteria bacterium]|nr:MAG: tripartite tricarboxylate transporter substrate binding protein [Alphaproteobacteria bacterium]